MNNFNSLIVPTNLKKGTLWDFLTYDLLQQSNKLKKGPFGAINKFSKNVSQSLKGRTHSAEKKVRTFCCGILVRKYAPTNGFERLNYATCGLKRESCRQEKKHFPIILANRKCKEGKKWWNQVNRSNTK